MVPLHCVTPMGFAPSAGWAQALTDHVIDIAGLPSSRRIVLGGLAPAHLPVWGGVIDDVWALGYFDGHDQFVVPNWMARVDSAWASVGSLCILARLWTVLGVSTAKEPVCILCAIGLDLQFSVVLTYSPHPLLCLGCVGLCPTLSLGL
jgi:hypothetical protein